MALIKCGTNATSLPTLTFSVYSAGASGSFLCDDLLTMGYNKLKCTSVSGGGHAEYKPSSSGSSVTMTVNTEYTLGDVVWITTSGSSTSCTFEMYVG